jgi:hypothetical protein
VKVDAAVRKRELTISTALEGLAAGARYTLRVRVMKDERAIKEFASRRFRRAS